MATIATELQTGLIVVGSDGERIGTVKEIGEGEFRIDVRLAPDISVPLANIETIAAGLVILKMPAALILSHHLPDPQHL